MNYNQHLEKLDLEVRSLRAALQRVRRVVVKLKELQGEISVNTLPKRRKKKDQAQQEVTPAVTPKSYSETQSNRTYYEPEGNDPFHVKNFNSLAEIESLILERLSVGTFSKSYKQNLRAFLVKAGKYFGEQVDDSVLNSIAPPEAQSEELDY